MDRATLERHLAQAEVHIAAAQDHVRRQEEIVADLERLGRDSVMARQTLGVFRRSLELYLVDRARIQQMLDEISN
jgi:hypothetical protein